METIELKKSISFKNILLATDFSEVSKNTLDYAAAIARGYDSTIHIVHVIPPEPRTFIPLEPLPSELDRSRLHAEMSMKRFVCGGPLDHIPHEVILEQGPIWGVISELIRSNEIDLLVLGTHGREGLKKLVLGSVAEEIFRLAPCPVLTVGPAVSAETGSARAIRRILFATDFGPASLSALPYAISLASESKAKLILLHVLSSIRVLGMASYWYVGTDLIEQPETARWKTVARLKKLMPPEADLVCEPEFLVRLDILPDGILTAAADNQANLIVMGVNRVGSAHASAHMPWAIAHEVVRHAKCPVLTVRG
jgi:nucleotide-binding universal stress UspA family protein